MQRREPQEWAAWVARVAALLGAEGQVALPLLRVRGIGAARERRGRQCCDARRERRVAVARGDEARLERGDARLQARPGAETPGCTLEPRVGARTSCRIVGVAAFVMFYIGYANQSQSSGQTDAHAETTRQTDSQTHRQRGEQSTRQEEKKTLRHWVAETDTVNSSSMKGEKASARARVADRYRWPRRKRLTRSNGLPVRPANTVCRRMVSISLSQRGGGTSL